MINIKMLYAIFIFSIKFIPSESIAVVAGLITLVVTSLSTILRGIVENGGHQDDAAKQAKERGIIK